MPHSPGIYVALVLEQVSEIFVDPRTSQNSMGSMKSDVQKIVIRNNLFLDIFALSKNLQLVLK